jgi:hypothetical protein
MSANTDVDTQDLPVEELIDLVSERLNPGPVLGVETRPNGFSTKLASSFVTLHLEGGEALALFVKKVRGGPGSHRPDPTDREAQVYRAFSDHSGFAAPELVGIIGADDPHLVLVAVPGWDLRYRDLDHWALAAEELGAMHAAFASEARDLESYDFLARHDAPTNLATAQHAHTVLRGRHADAAGLIQGVVEGYERVAVELAEERPTLVHGDLAPKNIVIADRDDTKRAVFVDWEWAGIGPGLGDIADLVNGLDEGATRRMLEAYAGSAAGAVVPTEDGALSRSFKLALLHKTMFRLGRSIDWKVSDDQVTSWARTAADLYSELG